MPRHYSHKECLYRICTGYCNLKLKKRTYIRIIRTEVMDLKQLAINGTIINEPKVLKLSPLLLYVKIEDDAGSTINCLVHRHGLNFLYQATTDSQVAMYGHYNGRKQFIIDKFTVLAKAA